MNTAISLIESAYYLLNPNRCDAQDYTPKYPAFNGQRSVYEIEPTHCYISNAPRPDYVSVDKKISVRNAHSLSILEQVFNATYLFILDIINIAKLLIQVPSILLSQDRSKKALSALASLGGVNHKIMQYFGNAPKLHDLFKEMIPKALRVDDQTLAIVNNENPCMTYPELRFTLWRTGLDYDPDRLHERECLGVGTIGEVQKMPMKDGTQPLIKLVGIEKPLVMRSQINQTRIVFWLLGKVCSEFPSIVQYGTSVFLDVIKNEFYLDNEIKNNQQLAGAFEALKQDSTTLYDITSLQHPVKSVDSLLHFAGIPVDFRTPTLIAELASTRSMGMECVDGVTLGANDLQELKSVICQMFPEDFKDVDCISNNAANIIRTQLYGHAMDIWLTTFAKTGVFNADAHPGNIMVHFVDGKLEFVFIDLGCAYTLPEKSTQACLSLSEALRSDSLNVQDTVQDVQYLSTFSPDKVNWEVFQNDLKSVSSVFFLAGLFDKLKDHNISMCPEFGAFCRSLILKINQKEYSQQEIIESLPQQVADKILG